MNMAVNARLGGLIGRIADVVLVAQVLFDVRENLIERAQERHLVEAAASFPCNLLEHFFAVRHILPAASRHRHGHSPAPAPHPTPAVAAVAARVAVGGGIGKEHRVDQRIGLLRRGDPPV